MTASDAAARLGCKLSTVYALCQARKLGHYRVGLGRGVLVIGEDHLADYLAAAEVPPVATAPAPPNPRPRGAGRARVRDFVAEYEAKRRFKGGVTR